MEVTSDPVSYFFVLGIAILVIACIASLWPIWQKAVKKFSENSSSLWPIVPPAVITLAMAAGILFIFIDQGTTFDGENVDLQGPKEVREDFAEAHEKEAAAAKPLTKAEMQEERVEKAREEDLQEKKEKADQDKASAESIKDFRERLMNRGE